MKNGKAQKIPEQEFFKTTGKIDGHNSTVVF